MRYLKWTVFFIALLLIGGLWYARPLLTVGAGYAAKMACSCHYLQGRNLEDIHQADLSFSALKYVKIDQEADAKAITASFLGFISQTARYIEGRGCVLIVDSTTPTPEALAAPAYAAATAPLPVYDTLPPNLDKTALTSAVDHAFIPLSGGGTRGVVILHNGHLVHEKYAPDFNRDTPLLGWSMTKSITNALVGIMVKNGNLRLDQNHLFPEWADDGRAEITLADLLHMNSGLEWNEAYGGVSDATQMLYLNPNMAAFTKEKPLAYTPDTHWNYSSGTTNILSQLIRTTLNDEKAYTSLLQDSLFMPLGMHSAIIECDQSGTLVGSSYGWATARDWARFGQLYLQDGKWDNYAILPEGWVDYTRQIATGSEGVYGAQIWLPDPTELVDVPDDLFMFRGFQDQRIVIIPSRQCVMVRLGMNDDKTFALGEFVQEVLAALPE